MTVYKCSEWMNKMIYSLPFIYISTNCSIHHYFNIFILLQLWDFLIPLYLAEYHHLILNINVQLHWCPFFYPSSCKNWNSAGQHCESSKFSIFNILCSIFNESIHECTCGLIWWNHSIQLSELLLNDEKSFSDIEFVRWKTSFQQNILEI